MEAVVYDLVRSLVVCLRGCALCPPIIGVLGFNIFRVRHQQCLLPIGIQLLLNLGFALLNSPILCVDTMALCGHCGLGGHYDLEWASQP